MKDSKRHSSRPSEGCNTYNILIYSQNVRGLRGIRGHKHAEIIEIMETQDVFAWCLQETWALGDETQQDIDTDYVTIHHGLKEKQNRRGSLGVGIVLSPQAWKGVIDAGNKIDYYGQRIIAVSIALKDGKGEIVKLRLISAYAPDSSKPAEEHALYESQLAAAIANCEADEALIMGADMNASFGHLSRDQIHQSDNGSDTSIVGNWGVDWVNAAGRRMSSFIGMRNLCLPSTFFQKAINSVATWYHPCNKVDKNNKKEKSKQELQLQQNEQNEQEDQVEQTE